MRRRRTWNRSARSTAARCTRHGRFHARNAKRKPKRSITLNAEKDQLITLAHSMEVSYSALDAEAGLSYDTTVRVSVQPNRYYPDYVAVTLLWLASSHIFHGIEEFNRFRDDFEDRPEERYQQIMDSWPLVFGSTEKAMKKLFAPAKPVVKRPPLVAVPALQETRMGSGRHHRPEGDAAAAETEPVAALVPCLRPAFRVHDGRPHLMQFQVLHRGDDGHAQKHVPHRAAELRDHRHRSRTRGR